MWNFDFELISLEIRIPPFAGTYQPRYRKQENRNKWQIEKNGNKQHRKMNLITKLSQGKRINFSISAKFQSPFIFSLEKILLRTMKKILKHSCKNVNKEGKMMSLRTWTGWIRPWFNVSAITLRAKWRTLDCAWKKASRTCLRYNCMIELLIPEEMSPISFRSSCFATFFPV